MIKATCSISLKLQTFWQLMKLPELKIESQCILSPQSPPLEGAI